MKAQYDDDRLRSDALYDTIDWQVIAQYDNDRLISNDADHDRLTSDSAIW